MQFIVTRTSDWLGKPCDEAKRATATYLDYRRAKSLEEAQTKSWFKEWYDSTTNHRVDPEYGVVVGEAKEKDDVWVIEINSLDELLQFIRKYGQVVISECPYKEYPYEIEIYDTWRE